MSFSQVVHPEFNSNPSLYITAPVISNWIIETSNESGTQSRTHTTTRQSTSAIPHRTPHNSPDKTPITYISNQQQ